MTGNVHSVAGSCEKSASREAEKFSLWAETGSTMQPRLDLSNCTFPWSCRRRFDTNSSRNMKWFWSLWIKAVDRSFVEHIFIFICCGWGENNRLCRRARLTWALEPPPRPQIQIQTDVRWHLPGRKHAHFKQKQAIFFLAHEDNSAHWSTTQSRHCLQTGFVNSCKLFAIQPEKAPLILPHHLNKRVVPSGTQWNKKFVPAEDSWPCLTRFKHGFSVFSREGDLKAHASVCAQQVVKGELPVSAGSRSVLSIWRFPPLNPCKVISTWQPSVDPCKTFNTGEHTQRSEVRIYANSFKLWHISSLMTRNYKGTRVIKVQL